LQPNKLVGGAEECAALNCAQLGGGAALNAGGELGFHDCVLSHNVAFNVEGGEIAGGGAILNIAGHFLLDRTGSTVSGNTVDVTDEDESRTFGIGIYNTGTTSLINSAGTEDGLTTQLPEEGLLAPGSGSGIYNGGTMWPAAR
jgi:hypothetical protein